MLLTSWVGPADPSTGTELPLGPADMPRGCKPEQWTRAVALRDARASIEHDTVQLTNWVQLLSDQLLVLQQEEQHLTASQKAAEQVFNTFMCTRYLLL